MSPNVTQLVYTGPRKQVKGHTHCDYICCVCLQDIFKFVVSPARPELGCPIFASFNYSLRSESNSYSLPIRFVLRIFASKYSLRFALIRFKTKRIFASKYLLRFALICFKIFASEQSECKKFTSQKGAK